MNDDHTLVRPGLPSTVCRICEDPLGRDDQWVLQSYGDRRTASLDPPVVGVCPSCRPAVAELLDGWASVPEPPVDADSIAAGYARVAEDCSFCRDPLSEPPVGVEWYRAGTDHATPPVDRHHYALCGHCTGVFETFLQTLGE
ncbi:hypothetical protein GOC74_08200 [Halomicrobium mukohataei]|uniref:Uncharacterized protein n=1 Tax=Halomicrobium mukohataei TaxID=57705 RepID=A0A847UFQ3_9EURY|nr:hypothetical protein [Halomicrobium mukohataei]NLV09908.1 hypothetical protein [Halomicrobium mukohataei]